MFEQEKSQWDFVETDEAAVFSANFSLDVLYPWSEDEVT